MAKTRIDWRPIPNFSGYFVSKPIGERSGTHKLTIEDVIKIRKEYGKKSLRKLASEYGVSHTAIRRAALGIKWGHLKEGIING